MRERAKNRTTNKAKFFHFHFCYLLKKNYYNFFTRMYYNDQINK